MLSGTVHVLRNNEVLYEGELLSLKHLKVRSLLNNAQQYSERTQEQQGSRRGGTFKGIVSRDEYFFESLKNGISTYSLYER